MLRLPSQVERKTEEKEYDYFMHFLHEEDTFCSDNAIFAGINLKNVAKELHDIVKTRPHDQDGILGKASEVLCALCIFCLNNRSLKALEKKEDIEATKMKKIEHAEEIEALCTKIVELESPTSIYNFIDQALPEIQNHIYNISRELLGLTGLTNIHDLMCIAIEMHCNEDLLMQRFRHIKRHKVHRETYEKKSIYPWKYYWNPHATEMVEFISGCSEITMGKPYTLTEMISILTQVCLHKIRDHEENTDDVIFKLACILEVPKSKVSLLDQKWLIYPMQKNIYPLTFEEIWNDKYPNEIEPLPKEIYHSIYQPDWNIPLWCKPSFGPVPLGYCNRKGTPNYCRSNGPGL